MSRSSSSRKGRRAGHKSAGAASAPGPDRSQVEALIGLYRSGRHGEAMSSAREFVQRWPRHAVGWNVLAASAEGLGQLSEAAEAYRRGLALEPGNAGASNNLGNVLRALGRAEEAVSAYRQAVSAQPSFAEGYHNLGLALGDLGRLAEAAEAYRTALGLNRSLVDTHVNLGNVLRARGDLEAAEQAYRGALALAPGHAGAWSNLAELCVEADRYEEAFAAYDRALEIEPERAQLHSNRGLLAARMYDLEQAEASCRRALELAPDDPAVLTNLGNVLKELGATEEAERHYQRVVELEPGSAAAHENLANLLADRGSMRAAARSYRRALELRPQDAGLWWYRLAHVKQFKADDPDLDALAAALERTTDSENLAYLNYALAKAYRDTGASDRAVFSAWEAGARAKRDGCDYDVADDEARMAALAAVFTRECLQAYPPEVANPTEAPIFIVGMPRSGTTLVEQILAAHPRVHAAGEQLKLSALVRDLGREPGTEFPHGFTQVPVERLRRLADDYADQRRQYQFLAGRIHLFRTEQDGLAPDIDRITDKLPANFQYLGLIALLLPNARIIHLRRDPVDTCLSCYTQLFGGGQQFSYDLTELGRYYRAYDALMQHWRSVLPAGRMLEIDYEQLVAEPEPEVRRLLDHCGLEWEPACLEFHRVERAVRTASSQQVRQPLYRHAVGRWRRYRDRLGPLLEALGPLAPSE